ETPQRQDRKTAARHAAMIAREFLFDQGQQPRDRRVGDSGKKSPGLHAVGKAFQYMDASLELASGHPAPQTDQRILIALSHRQRAVEVVAEAGRVRKSAEEVPAEQLIEEGGHMGKLL